MGGCSCICSSPYSQVWLLPSYCTGAYTLAAVVAARERLLYSLLLPLSLSLYLKLLPEPSLAVHVLVLFVELGHSLVNVGGQEGGGVVGMSQVDDSACVCVCVCVCVRERERERDRER